MQRWSILEPAENQTHPSVRSTFVVLMAVLRKPPLSRLLATLSHFGSMECAIAVHQPFV